MKLAGGRLLFASLVFIAVQVMVPSTWQPHVGVGSALADSAAVIASPPNGTILTGGSATFTWADTGATSYQLWYGTVPNSYNVGYSPIEPNNATSATVTGLPTNGSTIFFTLCSNFGGTWLFSNYAYTAGTPIAATIITPTNNATFTSTSPTFSWNNAGADEYQVWVGSTAGAHDLGTSPIVPASGTTATVTGLPNNGSKVYVTLYSLFNATWLTTSDSYLASQPSVSSPTASSVPVMEGWWLLPVMLAGLTLFARRRKG